MPRPPASAVPLLVLLLAAATACSAPRPALAPPEGEPAAAAVDWSRAEIVTVALDDYAFRPDRLVLRQRQPYRLRLVNGGARGHDFTAPAFFRTVALRGDDPLAAVVRAQGGSVDVPAGATREVALVPLRAGSYPLDCEKPLHATFGMTGEIVVSP